MAANTLNGAITALRQQVEGIEKLNVHALRHTARTHLAELGVKQEVAEMPKSQPQISGTRSHV